MATDPRVRRARQLRSDMTLEERLVWWRLRNQQLGVKFRRQVPIGAYIADFASVTAKVIVELDGSQHTANAADVERDQVLASRGFEVLRFHNHQVREGLDDVVDQIIQAIAAARDDPPQSSAPGLSQLPQRGSGYDSS